MKHYPSPAKVGGKDGTYSQTRHGKASQTRVKTPGPSQVFDPKRAGGGKSGHGGHKAGGK